MSSTPHGDVIALRFLVGFLGEQGQTKWWPSRFLSATSESFLKPVFAKTLSAAQYHGVRDAASRVHDEHIGVGRVFHLFRLPEAMEQRLSVYFSSSGLPEDGGRPLTSQEVAMARLRSFFKSAVQPHPGPVQLGAAEDLHRHVWLSRVASAYHAAFESNVQTFPYFVEIPSCWQPSRDEPPKVLLSVCSVGGEAGQAPPPRRR